eukprot:SM000217S06862  [mRNA]  locus=s217:100831:102722:- [translate_table: standard]
MPPQLGSAGRTRWLPVAGALFTVGNVLGPPLDGIHSAVGLQIYDKGAVTLGQAALQLHTNLWVCPKDLPRTPDPNRNLKTKKVFPLLGVYYASVGLLQIALDEWLAEPGRAPPPPPWPRIALCCGVLALLLEASCQLYTRGLPYPAIFATLFALGCANWVAFDATWWGFALATIVGLGAPGFEVLIMRYAELWHYPHPDLTLWDQGIVTWTSCCYFFYTPFLAGLSRKLAAATRRGTS